MYFSIPNVTVTTQPVDIVKGAGTEWLECSPLALKIPKVPLFTQQGMNTRVSLEEGESEGDEEEQATANHTATG